jgi:hypothetical protein
MATLLDLLVEFVTSTIRLFVVFTTEVALREPFDPLALVSLAVGSAITAGAVGFFGYLVAGAALDALGVDLSAPGRSPPPDRG